MKEKMGRYLIFIFLSVVLGEKLLVQDSGMVKFDKTHNAMVFFIQVIERGPTSSRIFVETAECCESLSTEETDCATFYLVGGDMDIVPHGTSRNLTLFYPTLYGYNRHGSCLVDITFNNNQSQIRHRIDFNTIVTKEAVPMGLEPFYDPLQIEPCATLDLDPFYSCEPVVCQSKYNGLRNYFNPETNICEKAPTCDRHSFYIPVSNTCEKMNPSITDQDLKDIEQELPISLSEDNHVNMVCHRGTVKMGTCVCDPGWESNAAADELGAIGSVHYCDVQCPGGATTSAPSLLYEHFFDICLASAIVGVILIVIYWSEKRYQARIARTMGLNDNVMYFTALSPKN